MRRRIRVREQAQEDLDLARLARALLAAAREQQEQTVTAPEQQPGTKSEVRRGA